MIVKGLNIKNLVHIKTVENCLTTYDGLNEKTTINTVTAYNHIQNTDIFWISFWFKLTDFTADDLFVFLGNNGTTTFAKGFEFRYENRVSVGSPGLLSFRGTRGVTSEFVNFSETVNNVITDNDLHHLLVTSNGTITKIYLDSVSQTMSTDVHSTLSSGNATNILELGNVSGGAGFFLDGGLHDVVIGNNFKSDLEVLEIFNLGRNPNYSFISGVLSHWKMKTLNPIDEIGSNDGVSVNMDPTNIVCG